MLATFAFQTASLSRETGIVLIALTSCFGLISLSPRLARSGFLLMTAIEDAGQSSTWDEEEQQRPAKKRRFFVEESPDKSSKEEIVQDDTSIVKEEPQTGERLPLLREDGFDIDMIETVLGEKLDDDTLYTLYLLADKKVETGKAAS